MATRPNGAVLVGAESGETLRLFEVQSAADDGVDPSGSANQIVERCDHAAVGRRAVERSESQNRPLQETLHIEPKSFDVIKREDFSGKPRLAPALVLLILAIGVFLPTLGVSLILVLGFEATARRFLPGVSRWLGLTPRDAPV